MRVEWLRTLYDYSRWANERVIAAASELTTEQLTAPSDTGYGSLRYILMHTMGTQWLWLARWQGESPRVHLDLAAFPDLASIRTRWAAVERATGAFIAGLGQDQLEGTTAYATTWGDPRTHPLWQLMLHQANHATQHRSEAAYLLTQRGCSPGDLDLLRYLERS